MNGEIILKLLNSHCFDSAFYSQFSMRCTAWLLVFTALIHFLKHWTSYQKPMVIGVPWSLFTERVSEILLEGYGNEQQNDITNFWIYTASIPLVIRNFQYVVGCLIGQIIVFQCVPYPSFSDPSENYLDEVVTCLRTVNQSILLATQRKLEEEGFTFYGLFPKDKAFPRFHDSLKNPPVRPFH